MIEFHPEDIIDSKKSQNKDISSCLSVYLDNVHTIITLSQTYMENSVLTKNWTPFSIFYSNNETSVALLVLNQPLTDSWDNIKRLWKKACLRITVDGGTDCFYELTSKNNVLNEYIPDIISGDFDSVKQQTLDFYRQMGSEVIETPDQDATDFTKALCIAANRLQEMKIEVSAYVTLVEVGGRFDHIFGLVNTLFLAKSKALAPVYLVSSNSITWLLEPGVVHNITIPNEAITSWCGLIPIGEPCQHVSTTGLKWNLKDQPMNFGGMVSTSNTFSDTNITVETDNPLLFTMGRPINQ